MKNIYEWLKEVPADEESMREAEQFMPVTDLEKARVKAYVRKRSGTSRPSRGRKRAAWTAAAVILLTVGSIGYIGVNHPAYAAELPIVGDIFRFLDNGRTGAYDLYQENANEINLTKEDSGIAITLKEAVFDGRTVYYTFEIVTDQNLGDYPVSGGGMNFQIKGYRGGMTGSEGVEKVVEGHYIGQANYSIDEQREKVDCRLDIREIRTEAGSVIKGKWPFSFTLQAVEQNQQLIGKSVTEETENLAVIVDSLEQTPMSFSINYTQILPEKYRDEHGGSGITAEVSARDDLGNVYIGESQGGRGNVYTGETTWRTTFGKLDENAKQLIITPSFYFSSGSGGGVAINDDGTETPLESYSVEREPRTVILDDIIVELQ